MVKERREISFKKAIIDCFMFLAPPLLISSSLTHTQSHTYSYNRARRKVTSKEDNAAKAQKSRGGRPAGERSHRNNNNAKGKNGMPSMFLYLLST